MDSFTSKLLAFALPALGIFIFGQRPDFFSANAEPQAVQREASAAAIQEPETAVVRRNDDAERFLDAGRRAVAPPLTASSDLRAKMNASRLSTDTHLAVLNRLPRVVEEAPDTSSKQKSMVKFDSIADEEQESNTSSCVRLNQVTDVDELESDEVREQPSRSPVPDQRETAALSASSPADGRTTMASDAKEDPPPFRVQAPQPVPYKTSILASTFESSPTRRPLQVSNGYVAQGNPSIAGPQPNGLQSPEYVKFTTETSGIKAKQARNAELKRTSPRGGTAAVAITAMDARSDADREIGSELVDTKTLSNSQSIATENSFAATPEVNQAAKNVVSPRRQIPSSSPTLDTTSESAWTPVDIRTIDIATQVTRAARPAPINATREDSVLAGKQLQLAFELVQRQAPYSARSRFIEALRIVARSLDEQVYSTKHTIALNNALTAYEEANDFFPASTRPGENVNLHVVIGGHDTPVLQTADVENVTPRNALREYLAYAEQEFVAALGKEQLASKALYGLGRLESAEQTTDANSTQVRAHRSLTLHQTALLVDDRNFAAANELGVLLANYGEFDRAIQALKHCVQVSPQRTAWKNLSNIYARMGRSEDARLAENQANRAGAMDSGAPFATLQPKVQWVDANTFASISPRDPSLEVATGEPTERTRPPISTAAKSRFWSFSRKR